MFYDQKNRKFVENLMLEDVDIVRANLYNVCTGKDEGKVMVWQPLKKELN